MRVTYDPEGKMPGIDSNDNFPVDTGSETIPGIESDNENNIVSNPLKIDFEILNKAASGSDFGF